MSCKKDRYNEHYYCTAILISSGTQNPAADVNDDDCITSINALMILQAAAEAISL